jgi:hypothetical protein
MASLVNQMVGALRDKPVWCALRCGLVLAVVLGAVVLYALADFLPSPYAIAR